MTDKHSRPLAGSVNTGTGIRPIAVYTDAEDIDPTSGIELLRSAGFEVRFLESQDPDVIVDGAHDAQALLVGYASISAEMISRLPNLKVISLISMGFNNVDIAAATAGGIWVTNLPGVATEEVATHALTLALASTRNLPFYRHSLSDDGWIVRPPTAPPRLSEATLGIVGLGRIGTRFGAMASRVFSKVIGYDPLLPDTAETAHRLEVADINRTSLDEVLQTSHVVSLHSPLTDNTYRMINAESLAQMQQGSFIINVSRGQLIDSHALRKALDSGWIAGAAVDVLDIEPPPADHPLLGDCPNIIVTPHIAFLSDRTEKDYVRVQAENVLNWYKEGRPAHPVNTMEEVS